jgi:DNA-directed RNA polymerase specialized sigma24 family protein
MERVADERHDQNLTPEEVKLRLQQLSPADLKRLERISEYWARSAEGAKDLRQEAYLRAIEGDRQCRRDQDFVRFLAGTMKSIRHSERKAAARLQPHREAFEREAVVACSPVGMDPLGVLLDEENEFQVAMGKLKLFGDDPVAMAVIEGIMEGFQGAELCELVGISPDELATKRRLIKRRLDAAGGLKR